MPRTAGLAAVLALCAGPALAQGLPASAAACVDALNAATAAASDGDPAPFAVDHCPAFLEALAASPWAATIPAGEAEYLEAGALEALLATSAAYTSPSTADLSDARLAALVAELEPFVAEPEPGLWERFTEWLAGLFESEDGERSWLAELIASISIPESWQRILLYGLLGLVVVLVLAILINELRLGGAFTRRAKQALRRVTILGNAADPAAVPSFDDIGRAPAIGRKVELLFTLVVDRVRQRYRDLLAPGLTHREIARAAARLDAPTGSSLAAVAMAAERVTYADWSPDDASWREILENGENLVRRLAEAPPDENTT